MGEVRRTGWSWLSLGGLLLTSGCGGADSAAGPGGPVDPPMLLVHGTADATVPVAASRQMKSALQAAGVPATLGEVTGAPHGFDLFDPAFPPASCTTLAFLARYLGRQESVGRSEAFRPRSYSYSYSSPQRIRIEGPEYEYEHGKTRCVFPWSILQSGPWPSRSNLRLLP